MPQNANTPNQGDIPSDDESEKSFAVRYLGPGETPQARVFIGNTELTMCVDTGASTTIIDEVNFLNLKPKPALLESKTPVFGFSACKPLEIIGDFETKLIHGLKSSVSRISVVKGNSGCLLSCSDSVKLEIVCFNDSK